MERTDKGHNLGVFNCDAITDFLEEQQLEHDFRWVDPLIMHFTFKSEGDRNLFLLHFSDLFEKV